MKEPSLEVLSPFTFLAALYCTVKENTLDLKREEEKK